MPSAVAMRRAASQTTAPPLGWDKQQRLSKKGRRFAGGTEGPARISCFSPRASDPWLCGVQQYRTQTRERCGVLIRVHYAQLRRFSDIPPWRSRSYPFASCRIAGFRRLTSGSRARVERFRGCVWRSAPPARCRRLPGPVRACRQRECASTRWNGHERAASASGLPWQTAPLRVRWLRRSRRCGHRRPPATRWTHRRAPQAGWG